ncbi:MAG TPA: ABC transporter permease [Candidatus Dormibacteraeota bacterium]|nr:ABC transporter permease [Candidatus Dormibacteraeota bacterium]
MAAAVTDQLEEIDWENPDQVGLWQDAWQRFRRNRIAVIGLVLVTAIALAAILARLVFALHLPILQDYLQQDPANADLSPFHQGHILGTDELGRDILSRLLYGAGISLTIGLLTQLIYLVIGATVGLTAGYFGGRVDNLLMRFVDVWYAFPDLLFLLVVVSVFGASLLTIFVAIGLIYWVDLARLIRGQVLSIKEKEYVEGARATGSSPLKIILRHLVPNSLGPVIVALTFGIPRAIFLEATLSFLGAGIVPPTPSWGVMIQQGYESIFAHPMEVALPAAAIAITMLSFGFIGDGLRDSLDPRMRR